MNMKYLVKAILASSATIAGFYIFFRLLGLFCTLMVKIFHEQTPIAVIILATFLFLVCLFYDLFKYRH
jgi:cytochrome c biogenesis protein CcdA